MILGYWVELHVSYILGTTHIGVQHRIGPKTQSGLGWAGLGRGLCRSLVTSYLGRLIEGIVLGLRTRI